MLPPRESETINITCSSSKNSVRCTSTLDQQAVKTPITDDKKKRKNKIHTQKIEAAERGEAQSRYFGRVHCIIISRPAKLQQRLPYIGALTDFGTRL